MDTERHLKYDFRVILYFWKEYRECNKFTQQYIEFTEYID